MPPEIDRRGLLRLGLGAACSAAAWPLATQVLHAAVPGENRLVVIVLRGAMDAIGLVQPWGDPGFAPLRPTLAARPGAGLADLDGFWGLADPLADLLALWRAGEFGIVQAVSTPYRDRRSHFDGQDLLESGGDDPDGRRIGDGGWLNRALEHLPGARAETAMAVGQDRMLLLTGRAPAGAWSPATELTLADDERKLLSLLYAGDPLFATALAEAGALSGLTTKAAGETAETLAGFAATVLAGESRIAAFSLGGWDTHRAQANAIKRPARDLSLALATLKTGLGSAWERTLVLAMTEFGRTARENGSGGTDHGTGALLLYAGGAARGGRVIGRWPGLGEGDLYAGRDLMPTDDVRRFAAWALRAQFGLDRAALEGAVFPGLALGQDPGLLA